MSPSEDQLRAALRDGEPDGTGGELSADRIMARAYGIRHRRLVRAGSVLGGVAAASVAGLLVGALATSSHSERHSSSASSNSEKVAGGNAAAGAGPRVADGTGNAATCPAAAPNQSKGTGTGSFFTGPVASITLCGYAPAGGAPLRATDGKVLTATLTGNAARQLAAGLDTARTTPLAEPCPLYRTAAGKLLVLVPVGSDGRTMAPITVTVLDNPCNQPVSNGTVVRYNWTPPSSVTPYLHQLAATTKH